MNDLAGECRHEQETAKSRKQLSVREKAKREEGY
jgi:hypothetical protein